MKSLVTLNEELDALRSEARAILDTIKCEKRRMDEAEEASYRAACKAIEAKLSEIKEEEERINNLNNPIEVKKMENKKFSLLRAIRSIVNGQPMDEANAAVIAAGKEQMRASGVNTTGAIVIPTAESRSTVSVSGTSGATVPVDVADIYSELRAASVLEKAGATFYTGLVGDLKVPMMTAAAVAWEEENGAADDAGASIGSVTLSPKRLSAYMDISKQMLVQDDGSNVEANLQANLIRAINDKFEATVLGNAAGTTTQPAGLFYGKSPELTDAWSEVCDLEAKVERANGNVTAIIASPEAKAGFRALTYNNNTRLVMQDGNLEGVPVYSTSNVAASRYLVGDFKYLCCGMWGGIDITVDPYTQAANGAIRLVVNVYMDAAVPTAAANVIKAGATAADASSN